MMVRISEGFAYFRQLLTDRLERIQDLGLGYDFASVSLESFGRTFKRHALNLDQHVYMLESLDIILGEEAVAFGISLRADEFRKLVCPETYQGGALPQDFSYFADCV